MKALLLVVVALLTVACGSAPVPAPEKKAATVRDDTALLLTDNRTSAAVVPDHLLGNKALPGGSLGEYEVTGKKYQLFIVETASAQDAAILLLDVKGTLGDAAYIAYMGGYFGADAGKPIYVFAKKQYLAGVAGLPQDAADPIARELAARLH
jgi:hypothetical protein